VNVVVSVSTIVLVCTTVEIDVMVDTSVVVSGFCIKVNPKVDRVPPHIITSKITIIARCLLFNELDKVIVAEYDPFLYSFLENLHNYRKKCYTSQGLYA